MFRTDEEATTTAGGERGGDRLVEAARAVGWTLRPADLEMLADLDPWLEQRPSARIAILVGNRASRLGRVIKKAYPSTTRLRYDIRLPGNELHAALAAGGRYDLIIDDSRRVRIRQRVFRHVFSHLTAGGIYLVRDVRPKPWPADKPPEDPVLWPYLCRLIERREGPRPEKPGRWTRDELFRADAIGELRRGREHLIVQNTRAVYAKMREDQMNAVIQRRAAADPADDRAEILFRRPAVAFDSRATIDPESLYDADRRFVRRFEVPEITARRYRGAVLVAHQVALQDQLVLPESYRHNQYPRLRNRRITDVGHYFATVDRMGPTTELPGRYFHLDAEWREHFGHLLTEQLARLWAWPELKSRFPDLKAVLSLQRGRTEPRQWELDIFAAAGIAPDELVPIRGTVAVQELVAATPMASMPSYIHPDIARLWRRVGDRLSQQAPQELAPGEPYPERIFITRPPNSKTRGCHNLEEVEDYVTSEGFRVIRPELYPIAQQVQMFRSAKLIAGFGGSALFSLMFRPEPVPVIILRPSSYTASNEYMISSVLGHRLHYIDSDPDTAHPDRAWTSRAFHSGFAVDFSAEGRRLASLLAQYRALG